MPQCSRGLLFFGAELNPSMVEAARANEMEYFEKMAVWTRVPRQNARLLKAKILRTKWIDVNKGDAPTPHYRSRCDGKEFKTFEDPSYFSATPPLESFRLVISYFATFARVRGRHLRARPPAHGPC